MRRIVKRLGVFVFYDTTGIVDEYVIFLLDSMQEILSKLIIIVNGKIKEDDYSKLKKYTSYLYIRKNQGYDAGAYKDAFTKFLVDENWQEWEEILLWNDTFYGPVYSWKEIFCKMEKEKADYWGLSRWPGGKFPTGEEIPDHIQGYFLVCRRSLFQSIFWKKFWETMEYPKTYTEAIKEFEIKFSVYFSEKGFCNKAFTDIGGIQVAYGKNPYIFYIYDLITYIRFPIIKRRFFVFPCFEEVERVLSYLSDNTDYKVNMIYSHLKRLQGENRINLFSPFHLKQLEQFYNTHEKIFIYGCGKYGKNLAMYFQYRGWSYEGFLVTRETDKRRGVFVYKDMEFFLHDGIILALGKEAFNEVYPTIKGDLDITQLLLPEYRE